MLARRKSRGNRALCLIMPGSPLMREAMASDRPARATVSDSSNDRPTRSRPARRRRTRAQQRCSWECTLRSGLSGRQSCTKSCRSWCKQIGTETGLLPVVPFPGAPSCPSGRRRATRRDLATERGRLCRGGAVPLQPIHGPTGQGSKPAGQNGTLVYYALQVLPIAPLGQHGTMAPWLT